ncbi:MAG: hypothetical protein AAB366_03390 [Patescibacteria group bacterium]
MAKTSRAARRHMMELGRLFNDFKEISDELMSDFIQRYEKKKYLNQSLKRLIGRGFIKKQEGKLTLTEKGKRFFRSYFPILPSVVKWDGKWRIVSFDVPGGYSVKRDQLRGLLKEFDFYQLQKSVWICPNFVAEEFWKIILKEELNKYCKMMVVDIMEGDSEIKKYFKII